MEWSRADGRIARLAVQEVVWVLDTLGEVGGAIVWGLETLGMPSRGLEAGWGRHRMGVGV